MHSIIPSISIWFDRIPFVTFYGVHAYDLSTFFFRIGFIFSSYLWHSLKCHVGCENPKSTLDCSSVHKMFIISLAIIFPMAKDINYTLTFSFYFYISNNCTDGGFRELSEVIQLVQRVKQINIYGNLVQFIKVYISVFLAYVYSP